MKNYLLKLDAILYCITSILKLGKKQINTPLKFFLIVILNLTFNSNLNAQKNNIYELTNNETEMNSLFGQKSNASISRAHTLIYDLHPTIYIQSGTTKQPSEKKPVKLVLKNIESFKELQKENSDFNSIELIKINLHSQSDLKQSIDLSTLKSFNSLKYIYLLCYFEASENGIKNFILNPKPGTTLFFIKATQR